MNFDAIKQDTPRIVIEEKEDRNGNESFGWGVIGTMPIATTVGFITRVQAELAFRSPKECPTRALVIIWDEENKKHDYCVNKAMNIDPLVGVLELVKQTLLQSQMAAIAQARQQAQLGGLLGVDGRPINRRLLG